MKITRVFLKPDGVRWIDFGNGGDVPLPQVWMAIQVEGFIVGETAAVPRDQIHSVMSIDIDARSTTLVSFPGGKPN